MANDTLSPVGFERPFIKTNVSHEARFAMACLLGRHGGEPADMVRHLLWLGLEQMGWSEERIIREYAEYRVRCLRSDETNAYGKE